MGANEDPEDNFKKAFKKFKSYDISLDKEIVDLRAPKGHPYLKRIELPLVTTNLEQFSCWKGFRHPSTWEVYTLTNVPRGLMLISQVLTDETSSALFDKFLTDIPNNWKDKLQFNTPLLFDGEIDYANLRWITFGHHYNWKTKLYERVNEIPTDIVEISKFVAHVLNLNFKAEGGIINYYTTKSTLCPHSDHSELNHEIPLLSLSLGSPAIYLVGGKTRASLPIVPIRLQNSDLLIMSEESRLAFHAVPKVFGGTNKSGKKITRINLTIRQVY